MTIIDKRNRNGDGVAQRRHTFDLVQGSTEAYVRSLPRDNVNRSGRHPPVRRTSADFRVVRDGRRRKSRMEENRFGFRRTTYTRRRRPTARGPCDANRANGVLKTSACIFTTFCLSVRTIIGTRSCLLKRVTDCTCGERRLAFEHPTGHGNPSTPTSASVRSAYLLCTSSDDPKRVQSTRSADDDGTRRPVTVF